MVSTEAIETLERIARLKDSLPSRYRGLSSELGLYVQLRQAGGAARLQAGGKFRSRIDLRREAPAEPWQAKKYRPGDWENLIEPTLALVGWLEERGGVPGDARREFQQAIQGFRDSGHLTLPGGIASFTVERELGGIVRRGDSDETVMDLRSYIRDNPGQAAAWQALCHVFSRQRSYGASLDAINQALDLIPNEAEFHIDAEGLYFTAITNSVGGSALYSFLPNFSGACTLSDLECEYSDARRLLMKHLESSARLPSPRSANYEAREKLIAASIDQLPEPTFDKWKTLAGEIVDSYHVEDDGSGGGRAGSAGDTHPEFCEDIADRLISLVRRHDGTRLDSKVVYPWMVIFLLLGGGLTGCHPDKSRSMLATGRLPSPAGGVDSRREQEGLAMSEGFGGVEARLRSIERDFKTKDIFFLGQGLGSNWILMEVLSRLGQEISTPVGSQSEAVDVSVAYETLFGAIKDGIAFGLFISPRFYGTPLQSLVQAIPEEFRRHHVGETKWIDDLLDLCIRNYEEVYGVICPSKMTGSGGVE